MFELINLAWIALAIVLSLLLIAVIRALSMKSPQVSRPDCPVDRETQEAYAKTLQSMIQVPTLASRESPDARQFVMLQNVMEQAFPNVTKTLEKTVFDSGSMIWRWAGSNPSHAPLVLMAHQDVVPAAPEGWKHPPFSGTIDGEEIFGRGTMDTKNTLFGIFQAVEELLISGFVPEAEDRKSVV